MKRAVAIALTCLALTSCNDAVEEQRKLITDQSAEDALKPMREVLTVTLVSKKIESVFGGEDFVVTFGYKNNTQKDISGVKGDISVQDVFGDMLFGFSVSNDDTTIPAGQSVTLAYRSVDADDNVRKLVNLDDLHYKVVWVPKVIVFSDGSKLEAPPSDG